MRSTLNSSRKAVVAAAVLALAVGAPLTVGLACIFGSRGGGARPEWIAVTTLESLPADGVPRKVPIFVSQFDAWSRLPDEVAGDVFLRRVEKPPQMLALRATNHAGCPVEFNAELRVFEDLCWNGLWDIDGRRLHSIPEWGNLQPVRTAMRGDVVSVNLNDAIP